jgi:hypothetical protein
MRRIEIKPMEMIDDVAARTGSGRRGTSIARWMMRR